MRTIAAALLATMTLASRSRLLRRRRLGGACGDWNDVIASARDLCGDPAIRPVAAQRSAGATIVALTFRAHERIGSWKPCVLPETRRSTRIRGRHAAASYSRHGSEIRRTAVAAQTRADPRRDRLLGHRPGRVCGDLLGHHVALLRRHARHCRPSLARSSLPALRQPHGERVRCRRPAYRHSTAPIC
jgi:hypothetical protein